MLGEHMGKHLTDPQRRRWVELLTQAAHDAGLPDDAEFRAAFGSYIEWGSRLAVENSQAESKPPQNMPMPHWDWMTAAGPPGGRISALTSPDEAAEAAVVLPAEGTAVGFAEHVKPLFRASDRRSMSFVLDLWSVEDVRRHAEAILDRLRDGTMPCDGAWPADRVRVMERWVAEGMAD